MNLLITHIKDHKNFDKFLESIGFKTTICFSNNVQDLCYRILNKTIENFAPYKTYESNIKNNILDWNEDIYVVVKYSYFMRKFKIKKLK